MYQASDEKLRPVPALVYFSASGLLGGGPSRGEHDNRLQHVLVHLGLVEAAEQEEERQVQARRRRRRGLWRQRRRGRLQQLDDAVARQELADTKL